MDARENAYVLWFDELHRKDVALVGGKSSSLGELTTSTGVPVPYGYHSSCIPLFHGNHGTEQEDP